MDKKKENKKEHSGVRESMTAYQRTYSTENVHVMSLEQAWEGGMPLEESKRLIMDKVCKVFLEFRL